MNDVVLITAQTKEEAAGVEIADHISDYTVYYDFLRSEFIFVNEAQNIEIINEDNFLNGAIEEWHSALERQNNARDVCLKMIDETEAPENLQGSEYQKWVDEYDEAQRLANEKQRAMDNIFASLDSLAEKQIKPLHSASMISELIPVARQNQNSSKSSGDSWEGKVRYVRTSQVFSAPEKNGQRRAKWTRVPVDASGKKDISNFLKDNRFNKDIFIEQFKKTMRSDSVQATLKRDFSGALLPEEWQMQTEFLTDFAKNWSDALKYDSDKKCGLEKSKTECMEETIFSFSAAAQFLRFTHGVGIKGDFDLKKLRARLKAEAKAELALLEGQSKFIWQIPDRRGWMLSLPARNGVNADLGLIRIVFDIVLKGFVGATIAGEASISVDMNGMIRGAPGNIDNPAPEPTGNRFDFKKASQSLSGGGSVGGFVGAEATSEFGCAVQWKNPEELKKNVYASFAKYTLGLSAQAGAGANAGFKIGYDEKLGGLFVDAHAGLCFGYGGKGAMTLVVDALLIGEFLLWFIHQLRNVDFKYIRDLIEDDAYKQIGMLQFLLITGTYVLEGIQTAGIILSDIFDDYDRYNDRVKLMNRILDEAEYDRPKPEQVKYATPEVKGNILWMLTDTSYWDKFLGIRVQNNNPFSGESWLWGHYKKLKRAVVTVLFYSQSKSEYRNILQHMSMNMGEKSDWQANEQRLLDFLGFGEFSWPVFKWISTDYDGDFLEWLETLPEEERQAAELAMQTGNSFYDYLPDEAAKGVSISETFEQNRLYAMNGAFKATTCIAANFCNCCAPNAWDEHNKNMV